MLVITPEHPYFEPTLNQAPQWWRAIATTKADPGFCVRSKNGIFQPMNRKEFLRWAHEEGMEDSEQDFVEDRDDLDPNGDDKPDSRNIPRVGQLFY